jgi:arabinofuranosyltransferase
VNGFALPSGWEHHAAPVATFLDPLGPSIAWWAAAALLAIAAIAFLPARPRVSLVLAFVSALALGIARNGLVDDAYIQFRYAANLAAGRGPVFNPGERVEGASGGIWIVANALASALTHKDPALCGRVLSLVASVCAVAAAAVFGHACGGRRGAALAAIVWGSIPTAALYAATGLETSAYAMALWSVAASVVHDRRGPAAAAGALVAMLRPEAVVLALGAAPFSRRLGRAGQAGLMGCVAAAVFIAFARLAWYGAPVPRPALVKGMLAPAGMDAGLRYLGQAATEWWPLVPAFLWTTSRRRALLPILVPVALLTCLVVTRGGDWMPGGRYLVPLLVVLVALTTATAAGHVRDGVTARLAGRVGH